MEKHYLPWAKENKGHSLGDFSRYAHWLKPRFATKASEGYFTARPGTLEREMRDAGKSEATVKHALCIMRQAFNKAVVWRLWSGENPCKGVTFPKPTMLDNDS